MNIKRIIIAFIFLWSFNVHAAVVNDLYSVELDVESQSTSVRLQAFKKAFDDVVVKVSGSQDPLNSKAFKQSRVRANRYVKQFNYQSFETTQNSVPETQLKLKVVFDQKLIENLLRTNGFPVWGQVRPSILVLISKPQDNRHELISEETAPQIIEEIDELATKHGLPLQFPLLDLEDISKIDTKVPAIKNKIAVSDLAKRYQSDIVLLGELIELEEALWKANWESEFSGNIFQWNSSGSSQESVLAKSMSYLATLLAQEYALESSLDNKNNLIIKISGVNSLDEYLSVKRYLASLAVVENSRLNQMTQTSVSFLLNLRNSPEELQRLIELGNVIEQIEFPELNANSDSSNKLENNVVILNYQIQ